MLTVQSIPELAAPAVRNHVIDTLIAHPRVALVRQLLYDARLRIVVEERHSRLWYTLHFSPAAGGCWALNTVTQWSPGIEACPRRPSDL